MKNQAKYKRRYRERLLKAKHRKARQDLLREFQEAPDMSRGDYLSKRSILKIDAAHAEEELRGKGEIR